MKKFSVLIACVAILGFSTSAFATYGSGDANGNMQIGSTVKATLKLSAKVSIEYLVHSTNQGYSIAAYHSSGSKTYATSSGDTRIYYQDATAVNAPSAPASGATAAFTGWTAMQ